MTIDNRYIRLIFGLKLKSLRQSENLSLSALAKKTGMSVSYLNEIEAGKKYPKSDKIANLANALGVTYDNLVSLKLSNKLAPITELIASGIFDKLPLEHYGFDVRKVITLMSDAPTQLNALIATLIDLAKTSELRRNIFSRTALRTYKELNDNYFDDIEELTDDFYKNKCKCDDVTVSYISLKKFLETNFQYVIDDKHLNDFEPLSKLRAVLVNKGFPKLFINKNLSNSQKKFILGKEIYYQITKTEERAFIHSDYDLETFDQLLNNFKASYFSTALSINRLSLIKDLKEFFLLKEFNKKFLLNLIGMYDVSAEMLFQRISNIAIRFLDLSGMFFMRFNTGINSNNFTLSKELKLNISHYPGGYQTNEHYCRRWISIKTLEAVKSKLRRNPNYSGLTIGAVRSEFYNTRDKFIAFTIAKPSKLSFGKITSVTLGFPLDEVTIRKIKFWNDPKIQNQIVNDTCESCPISSCKVRAAQPITLIKKENIKEIREAINLLE